MIILYQFRGAYGLPSLSPFCTKLEVYLRLAGTAYESHLGNPQRAPKGKLPYVRLEGGRLLADSGLIIEHLERSAPSGLDDALGEEARAKGHLARRALEENLYWVLVYSRWIDDDGWAQQRSAVATMLPAGTRSWLPAVLRRRLRKTLREHGIGRHPMGEVYASGVADLQAVAALLGEQPYLLGETPSTYDATSHAFLWHVLATPADNPLSRAARGLPAIVAYVERMNERVGFDT